jgi:hypothetical protein
MEARGEGRSEYFVPFVDEKPPNAKASAATTAGNVAQCASADAGDEGEKRQSL